MVMLHGLQFSPGVLELVVGPMFSGKTEELIRRVRRSQIARVPVQVFRPEIDQRYHKTDVVSHTNQSLEAISISSAQEIMEQLKDTTRVVAIDEVQFFDEEIINVVSRLVCRGLRVLCAGLDLDYQGMPFGPVPKLLALADTVSKVSAVCTICGGNATRSQRLRVPALSGAGSQGKVTSETILVGNDNLYEARCKAHFDDFVDTAYEIGRGAQEGRSDFSHTHAKEKDHLKTTKGH